MNANSCFVFDALWLRAFLIWMVIAAAEIGQGALRVRYLNPRVGDRRARQIGVVTGSLLILAITWLGVGWIDAGPPAQWFGVGVLWVLLMLAVDFYFGRVVFRLPWRRIAADFNPRQGGFLGFGMLVLLCAPLLVAALQRRC